MRAARGGRGTSVGELDRAAGLQRRGVRRAEHARQLGRTGVRLPLRAAAAIRSTDQRSVTSFAVASPKFVATKRIHRKWDSRRPTSAIRVLVVD